MTLGSATPVKEDCNCNVYWQTLMLQLVLVRPKQAVKVERMQQAAGKTRHPQICLNLEFVSMPMPGTEDLTQQARTDNSKHTCLEFMSMLTPSTEDAAMQPDQMPLVCQHALMACKCLAPHQHSPMRKACSAEPLSLALL